MNSLDAISDWPVDHAAAAVLTRGGGVVAGHGDQLRLYRLASVTKPLVAYAVLVAVEEGAVELDQPAGPAGSTVRHLLAHASGLAFDERRAQAEPGRKRIYSSAGFEILAELVAGETGIPFPEYLTQAVFEPLGMRESSLPGPAGHGGQSSLADLTHFAAELLAPRLVSAQTLAEATRVQFPGLDGIVPGYGMHKPNDWGLGFEIRGRKNPHWTGSANSPETYGHFGQSGTFLWVDPRAGVACVALTDRAFGDWAKPRWPALADDVLTEFSNSSSVP
ncbi:serine hydrolase domain-containing protein [Rhodococcus aetherivorans]|uniref:serine hydrolase domain-containing protein n=1 Tax=Rhodococcus aetherivorans TaxID=191292 RepID=UPI000622C883|nr:serine hydrolase domain-containing protein [Rhodococcus aetherivorans]AKE90476.1 beta-lactamase [Rhodococcus aetherivorans]